MSMQLIESELTKIAEKRCRIPTLERRYSDELDFHEVSVWALKDMLLDAYRLGQEHRDNIII